MNNAISNNINLSMNIDKLSEDKKVLFKKLIIEYLIKSIAGETNAE